jgi:hypothetical protein
MKTYCHNDRRFVYLAITKTGSRSVRSLLSRYVDPRSCEGAAARAMARHHIPLMPLKRIFAQQGWSWQDCFKFTVVRNPWARVHSFHKHQMRIGLNPPNQFTKDHAMDFHRSCVDYANDGLSFSEKVCLGKVRLTPQVNWILLNDQNCLDAICRLETLGSDLRVVWDKLGLNPGDLDRLPRLNQSSGKPYQAEYTPAAREWVANAFQRDISILDYAFE